MWIYGQPGADLVIQESPKFHELAKKYRNDNIVFLAVSTDTEKKSWLSFIEGKEAGIPEYNCTDTKNLNEGWQIKYIPPFFIDRRKFQDHRCLCSASFSAGSGGITR